MVAALSRQSTRSQGGHNPSGTSQQRGGNGTRRPLVAQQPRPLVPLLTRMQEQYQQIAMWQCSLTMIGVIVRDDVVLWPLQCAAIIERLASLRQQAQQAQNFYRTLNPYEMQRIAPEGTLLKLTWLDEQVTELLLLLGALRRTFQAEPSLSVELHLLARQQYPLMMTTFDDVTAQLAALIEKAQEVQAWTLQ